MFDGEDFPYWKLHMETYLEAIDENVYTAAVICFPEVADKTKAIPAEKQYDKFNVKARNLLFHGLGKCIFNRVRNLTSAHEIWDEVCKLHLGTTEERELRYDLVTKKTNALSMLPHENANAISLEPACKLNGLGLT